MRLALLLPLLLSGCTSRPLGSAFDRQGKRLPVTWLKGSPSVRSASPASMEAISRALLEIDAASR